MNLYMVNIGMENIILNIVDDEVVEEGLGKMMSLGILATLLSASGIVEGSEFSKNIKDYAKDKRQTTSQVTITKKDLAEIVDMSKAKDANQMIGKWTKTQAINILARTLYMEARQDGNTGERMVLTVIWNRAGEDVTYLVTKALEPKQFSCWNSITNKTPETYSEQFPSGAFKGGKDQVQWDNCVKLATQAVEGTFTPDSKTWNAYYNPDKANPDWANQLTGTKMVGHHKVGALKDLTTKANRIKIAQSKVKPSTQIAAAKKTYKVQKGDTLYSIARNNKMKVQDLKTLNGLKSDTLSIGQTLKLA